MISPRLFRLAAMQHIRIYEERRMPCIKKKKKKCRSIHYLCNVVPVRTVGEIYSRALHGTSQPVSNEAGDRERKPVTEMSSPREFGARKPFSLHPSSTRKPAALRGRPSACDERMHSWESLASVIQTFKLPAPAREPRRVSLTRGNKTVPSTHCHGKL